MLPFERKWHGWRCHQTGTKITLPVMGNRIGPAIMRLEKYETVSKEEME
jgi:hypothetical protein